MTPTTHPLFWRDSALPFVELRQVLDGREVSYAPHSHKEWSIGAIINGESEFLCADRLHSVKLGTLVMMNPDVVHACNPNQDSPWAYYMMHLDKEWLAGVLYKANVRTALHWQNSVLDTLVSETFYNDFILLCEHLMSTTLESFEKEQLLQTYFIGLFAHMDNSTSFSQIQFTQIQFIKTQLPANKLYDVANYLNQNCLEETPINLVSAEFGFSTGYLVRAFKRHFNMTPHAYRLNRRVQLGQQALKEGQAIAEVAQAIGFSDQAHFQRVFKKRVAATPDQYRRSVS